MPSALLVFVLQNLQTVQSMIDTQAQSVQQLQAAMAQCKTQADDWQQVAKARLMALDEQYRSDIGFHASLTGTLSEIDKRLHANEMLLNEYMARKK